MKNNQESSVHYTFLFQYKPNRRRKTVVGLLSKASCVLCSRNENKSSKLHQQHSVCIVDVQKGSGPVQCITTQTGVTVTEVQIHKKKTQNTKAGPLWPPTECHPFQRSQMQIQICYSTKYSANGLRVCVSRHFLHVMKLVNRNNDATGRYYTTAVVIALTVGLTGLHRFMSINVVCCVS